MGIFFAIYNPLILNNTQMFSKLKASEQKLPKQNKTKNHWILN